MNTVIGPDMPEGEFYIEHDRIMLHVRLEYPEGFSPDKEGAGCPLVIVQHGFTGFMDEPHIIGFARAIREAGCATLMTELYGHGKSGGFFRDHTILKWMSEMMTIIDYAKSLPFVSSLHLCGHSQGGLLAILAGAMKRDVIESIIAVSPAVTIPEDARSGCTLGCPYDPNHVPDTLVMDDGNLLLGGNYIRAAQTIRVEPMIDAYEGEVLIVHGSEDETIPLQASVEAAARYKNACLEVIEGDDHCFDYHLDQAMDAIRDFMLSRRDTSSCPHT